MKEANAAHKREAPIQILNNIRLHAITFFGNTLIKFINKFHPEQKPHPIDIGAAEEQKYVAHDKYR